MRRCLSNDFSDFCFNRTFYLLPLNPLFDLGEGRDGGRNSPLNALSKILGIPLAALGDDVNVDKGNPLLPYKRQCAVVH